MDNGPETVLMISFSVVWIVAAIAARRLVPRRAGVLRGMLTVTGIPLLGVATMMHGPLPGLGGLVLGTALLLVPEPRPGRR